MGRIIIFLLGISLLQQMISCKKFVTIQPPAGRLSNTTVFQNETAATAAVLGIYEQMMENTAYFGNGGITYYAGLSADELGTTPDNILAGEFFRNQISPSNTAVRTALWGSAYQLIYQANAVIEGLSSTAIASGVKDQLTGEAKCLRAFFYFYLVNLFGDVPLVTKTDYHLNAGLPRSPATRVYAQILDDLREAVQLLPWNYVDADNQVTLTERIRPGKAAAEALLARVCLYLGDWQNAAMTAGLLISQTDRFALNPDLNQVFLAGSPESIWQLMPVIPGNNTGEGLMFVQAEGNPVYGFLDSSLLAGFEPGDLRSVCWTGSYENGGTTFFYPAKYKVNFSMELKEYYCVFRLAEQYLIRAEARNELQDPAGAAEDLNVIRTRAGLPPTPATDYLSLKTAIETERRHELFCEWGNRWLDLKRTGKINAVLSAVKSGWQATDSVYPLPESDIQNDPDLVQNPGY